MERRALLATTQTITQTLTLPATLTNFGFGTATPPQALSPTLNLFNPALGTLEDVRVTGSANISSQIKAVNTSPTSGTTITATLEGNATLGQTNATFEVDGLNFTITGGNSLSESQAVSASTGSTAFAPPNGVTFPPLVVSTPVSQTFTDAASLGFYTASAGRSTVTPTMSAQGEGNASAPGGNLLTSVMTSAGATITVSYDYLPGPPTLKRYGVHEQRTSLVVTFTTPISAADAQNVNNFQVIAPGPDRRFGTADDIIDPINVAAFNATTNSVTLIPVSDLNIHQPYELVIFPGQPSQTVIRFNHSNLAGFNFHGGRFFAVVDGRVVR